MTDLTAHDEAIAREAFKTYASPGSWDAHTPHFHNALRTAARLGRERTPQALSSPEHDEALIVEARRRHGLKTHYVAAPVARELLAMQRSGWTPEPDLDEEAVRAILGAWLGCDEDAPMLSGSFFQAALTAYRQAKRGEG